MSNFYRSVCALSLIAGCYTSAGGTGERTGFDASPEAVHDVVVVAGSAGSPGVPATTEDGGVPGDAAGTWVSPPSATSGTPPTSPPAPTVVEEDAGVPTAPAPTVVVEDASVAPTPTRTVLCSGPRVASDPTEPRHPDQHFGCIGVPDGTACGTHRFTRYGEPVPAECHVYVLPGGSAAPHCYAMCFENLPGGP